MDEYAAPRQDWSQAGVGVRLERETYVGVGRRSISRYLAWNPGLHLQDHDLESRTTTWNPGLHLHRGAISTEKPKTDPRPFSPLSSCPGRPGLCCSLNHSATLALVAEWLSEQQLLLQLGGLGGPRLTQYYMGLRLVEWAKACTCKRKPRQMNRGRPFGLCYPPTTVVGVSATPIQLSVRRSRPLRGTSRML